jgi:uncharacterized membrane protein
MTDRTISPNPAPPFRAVLTPNRSLSPAGFLILMSAIGLVSFALGIAFFSLGAWPVAGFLGLDVALIYYAFRANYRASRRFETVEINADTITITRVQPDGTSESFDFNTYWARIRLDEEPSGRTSLSIITHGRAFRFATCLGNDDRRAFASALDAELRTRRTFVPNT